MVLSSVQVAKRLAEAVNLLKRGEFAPQREHIKQESSDNYRYCQDTRDGCSLLHAGIPVCFFSRLLCVGWWLSIPVVLVVCAAHIKRFEGEVERPFAVRESELAGLTGMKTFSEFDEGFDALAAARKLRKHASSKKDKRRAEKRSLSRAGKDGEKRRGRDKDGRREKKHKSSSANGAGASAHGGADPSALIKRYVHKLVVATCGEGADPQLHKAVRRKAAGKVIEDWASKPRGDLPMHAWLNDKRKAQIQQLVHKYFVMSDTHTQSMRTRSGTVPMQICLCT